VRRREFITLLGASAVSWPLVTRAQQSDRPRRIGVLMSISENSSTVAARIAAFRQEFQRRGWSEGRNIRIDYRFAGGDAHVVKSHQRA
jgi:putative ABC transport system substrate-binding protein